MVGEGEQPTLKDNGRKEIRTIYREIQVFKKNSCRSMGGELKPAAWQTTLFLSAVMTSSTPQMLGRNKQRKSPAKKVEIVSKKVWTLSPFCDIVVC